MDFAMEFCRGLRNIKFKIAEICFGGIKNFAYLCIVKSC